MLILAGCSSTSNREPDAQELLVEQEQTSLSTDSKSISIFDPSELSRFDLKLLTNRGDHFHPRFSHDGKKIVYLAMKPFSHRSTEVYIYDLREQTHKRMTFSSGQASDALLRDNILFYISNTDALKERPRSLREDSDPDFNDLFRIQLPDESKDRLTEAGSYLKDLRFGRTTLLWNQGSPKLQVQFLSPQGATPLRMIPEAERISLAFNDRVGEWAWIIFNPPLLSPALQIKGTGEGGRSLTVSLEGLPSTEPVQLAWRYSQGRDDLLIQTEKDLRLKRLIAFFPEKSCFGVVDLGEGLPKVGQLDSLDFTPSGTQAVVTLRQGSQRQLLLSESGLLKFLDEQLNRAQDNCSADFPRKVKTIESQSPSER